MLIPPLGLLYLGAVIRRRGYDPHIIDLKVEHLPDDELLARLRTIDPAVIGIGAFTPDATAMHRTARLVKRAFPSIPVVIGGPHPSTDPEDVLANESVDVAVLGEGEATFVDVLDTLGASRPLADVAGLAVRDADGTMRKTATREPIRELDDLPFPAWDLVDLERYAAYHGATPVGRRRYMSIFTSRACPYQCTYCHTIFGKEFRARSPENVVAEIRELKRRYGIRVIEVSDDIFNLNWRRSLGVCEAIASADLGISMSFPNGLRADIMRPELLDAMRRAGTYFISYAVETGSPRLQQLIKKRLQLEHTRDVIARTVGAGIYTNGFFMMGFPTESREEVQATIDYACSTRLHSASFFLLCPIRGTEIYDWAVSEGMSRIHDDERFDYHTGTVNCSALDTDALVRLKRQAYLRFYFGKGRILRTLLHHPDKRSLGGLAWKMIQRLEIGRALRPMHSETDPNGGPVHRPLPVASA